MNKLIVLMLASLLMPILPVMAQESDNGEVLLGEFNSNRHAMWFEPKANQTIITQSDKFKVNITFNGSSTIPSLLTAIEIGVISPSGERIVLTPGDLPVTLNLAQDGNYTVVVAYGGAFSIIGLLEEFTGSGEYSFTIVKESKDYTIWYLLGGLLVVGFVIWLVVKHPRKEKPQVQHP